MLALALAVHLATQPVIPADAGTITLSSPPSNFRVVDGDTVKFDRQRVRLAAIDATEINQQCLGADGKPYPAGIEARDHLIALIAGRPVTCTGSEIDRYGRPIAFCTAKGDSETLNQHMVEDGEAFAYAHYDVRYVTAQLAARAERKGIWRGYCEEPWRFRQEEKR